MIFALLPSCDKSGKRMIYRTFAIMWQKKSPEVQTLGTKDGVAHARGYEKARISESVTESIQKTSNQKTETRTAVVIERVVA